MYKWHHKLQTSAISQWAILEVSTYFKEITKSTFLCIVVSHVPFIFVLSRSAENI